MRKESNNIEYGNSNREEIFIKVNKKKSFIFHPRTTFSFRRSFQYETWKKNNLIPSES